MNGPLLRRPYSVHTIAAASQYTVWLFLQLFGSHGVAVGDGRKSDGDGGAEQQQMQATQQVPGQS